jgi:hypothetical protein
MRMSVGLDDQEMDTDDEANGHASKPEGMSEEITEGLDPPLGSKPVVTMWKVETAGWQEPENEAYANYE